MEANLKEVVINGVVYAEKDKAQPAEKLEGMKYVIIRTQNAGVFAGYLKMGAGDKVVLKKARRLWYWDGAATLSQLAMEGVSKPQNCKFPCEVDIISLTQVIEVIDCTEAARQSIQKVNIWKA